MCVCVSLCTTVIHNTTQNSSDNFPSYPPDNHHSWYDVYYGGEGAHLVAYSSNASLMAFKHTPYLVWRGEVFNGHQCADLCATWHIFSKVWNNKQWNHNRVIHTDWITKLWNNETRLIDKMRNRTDGTATANNAPADEWCRTIKTMKAKSLLRIYLKIKTRTEDHTWRLRWQLGVWFEWERQDRCF